MAARQGRNNLDMAGKPAASRTVTASPVAKILERLAKLSGAGAAPERIARELEACLTDWKAEGLAPSDLTERMEVLRDDLEGGLESAVEQAADVSRDDKPGTRAAAKVVDGLRGAVGVVRAAMGTG
jgi:hypothetical protein